MRILGLYQHPEHVCFRYRLQAFRPYLEEAGHEVHFRGWPRWWLFESRFFQDLQEADLVIIQRRLLSNWQLMRVRQAAQALAFDFDDAVFSRDSFSPRGLESERRQVGFSRMVRAADIVLAGNPFLQAEALQWAEPRRVHLLPTCVNPRKYPSALHSPGEHATQLVWIGTASTLQGLEKIGPWLDKLGQVIPELKLKIISNRSLSLTHLPVRFCPWSKATETQELAHADIGISWLPPDTWSQGKCGLKVLQYMAAGLPVVANPVGVQGRLVRHGETGYLVESLADWQTALQRLSADPDLRRRMGARGRRLVEQEFNLTQGAATWLEILKSLQPSRLAALPLA
jgi:glycosyltransferase involved in cell wall biosynthesis